MQNFMIHHKKHLSATAPNFLFAAENFQNRGEDFFSQRPIFTEK
jgi:hypothetical protein